MKSFDSNTKRLLAKEAAMSSMNLGVGLTFIRKYDFASLGFIYQSFFSLSVGLERLMKLILVYEYIYTNDSFPTLKYLKSKGHNLKDLFDEVKKLTSKYPCSLYFDKLEDDPIFGLILNNLSDFAVENRYFNLNELTGNKSTRDPISRWDEEINSVIVERHFNPNTKRNKAMIEMAELMDGFSFVRHHDERGNQINSSSELVKSSVQIETKQKYGMYYVFCIVKAICHLQREQNMISRSSIHLDEFYMVFRTDYSYAKRLKTWNPHPPYKF